MAAMSAPRCEGRAMSCALLYPMPDSLALSVACSVLSSVIKGPLPNLIVDFSSSFLLQDRVAVHPKDVVDKADAKTFPKESKFCLWVLAQLNKLMHSSNDVCFDQELVRDELTGLTATPSVWLPAAIVETEASKRTSSIYHSGRVASRSAPW